MKAKLRKGRDKVALLKKALRAFTEGHPCEGGHQRGWQGMLHEEGCVGVSYAPDERDDDDEDCRCDGDYLTALVQRALR